MSITIPIICLICSVFKSLKKLIADTRTQHFSVGDEAQFYDNSGSSKGWWKGQVIEHTAEGNYRAKFKEAANSDDVSAVEFCSFMIKDWLRILFQRTYSRADMRVHFEAPAVPIPHAHFYTKLSAELKRATPATRLELVDGSFAYVCANDRYLLRLLVILI